MSGNHCQHSQVQHTVSQHTSRTTLTDDHLTQCPFQEEQLKFVHMREVNYLLIIADQRQGKIHKRKKLCKLWD